MRIFKKIFIISTLTAFVVLIMTQMLLKNSDLKNRLSLLYEFESQYVYSEKESNEGYILIKVSNPSDKLFLLQNGEKTMVLNNEEMQIDISDNSVIEIDGRSTDAECIVNITYISENTTGFYDENITVKSNIVILGRFFTK